MDLSYVAQFFGVLVIISNVIAMQMKKKKQIIFWYILGNMLSSIMFFLLQRYSGATICLFAIFQTFINKYFEKKEKDVPKVIITAYIIISIILGVITFNDYIDIMPIVCSILYTIMILKKKESNIRKTALINIIIWGVYDFLSKAYSGMISDLITTIATLVGIYRFDIKGGLK